MALYEDIQKVASTRQSPNARFRSEFIRSNMQNPGGFYKQFGADLNNPMGGTQSFNQPLQQLQSLPGASGLGDLFSSGVGNGTGMGSNGDYNGTYGPQTDRTATGGLLSNSPALGSLIGTGLGMAGMPVSGVLGQAVSGTPETQRQAVLGTGLGMGMSALGLGKYSGLAGMGINALQGRLPSKEQLAMTVAYMNPVTAPLAGLYGIGKTLTALNNERLADNYRRDAMYGLATPSPYGPQTTFGGWFGNPTNQVKDEDGLGLNPTTNTLGFNPVGITGSATPTDLNMGVGYGLSPAKSLSLQGALSALFGVPDTAFDQLALTTNPTSSDTGGGSFGTGYSQADLNAFSAGLPSFGTGDTTNSGGYSSEGAVGTSTSNYGSRQGFSSDTSEE